MVKTNAVVTGNNFYYAESHAWDFLAPEQVAAITEFFAEMAELAQKLSMRGEKGELKAVLSQEGLEGPPVLTIDGFSKSDMFRFQRRFSNGFDRVLSKFEDRKKK